MKPVRIAVTAALAGALCLGGAASARAAEEYGTITGRFVVQGDVPELPPAVAKGDPNAKDPAVCAAQDLQNQSLIVDPATKGVANVFVYMPKAPDTIHPDLQESQQKSIDFDQKNCQFIPHAMVVRTDQTVVVKSADPISHNTHTHPLRNTAQNVAVPAADRVGQHKFTFRTAERYPVKVTCDIHPWMSAYWVVTDHPYATVSAEDGKFTIEKIPAGEHQFHFWQELGGFVRDGKERLWNIKVEPGKTTDLGDIVIPVDAQKIAGK